MKFNDSIPRPEYPRPQMVRDQWMNLNGQWLMQTDRGDSGEARGFAAGGDFSEKIIVPFCRESVLSGVGDLDFCEHMWYRKAFVLPENWKDGRVILNIGACDYFTTLWVNGKFVGTHAGGYVSFSFDITDALIPGENIITVKVDDLLRSGNQPGGKQNYRYPSEGCMYRRTTGIWQTVWLEYVPETYITYTRYFADIDNSVLTVEAHTAGEEGLEVSAVAYYDGREVGKGSAVSWRGRCKFDIKLSELQLWEVGNGRLYDLVLTVGKDTVKSYFGMRKIECRKGLIYINGKFVFQRLVLDQGFYPDGIYTASTVDELYADVDRSLAMGFNGARLHQKVFEPLFLSYCDKKGYIVWGEQGNWGFNANGSTAFEGFIPEWQQVLQRDFNHPAIIGWCPINESNVAQNKAFMRCLAELTKGYDTTRAYIDASGWTHGDYLTDIYDLHDYEQNAEVFAKTLAPLAEGKNIDAHRLLGKAYEYMCDVTFVSEYGGTWWADSSTPGWGYGQAPTTADEFLKRFKALTDVLLDHPHLGGLCYTQLTDVEIELNGLYYFDRRPKFPPEYFRNVMSRQSYLEKNPK